MGTSAEPLPERKYRILMELGQGGTADVYLAMARGPNNFNKLVVLKTLRKSLQADPEFRAMFFNEARLAARLNHQNIVQTYEVIEENGAPTIVMEYLEGRPLSALLRRSNSGQPSLPMLLRIVADALAGLQHAHDLLDFDGSRLGVIHRDATPQNIFVTFDGQVKVLDFGIAKLGAWTTETRHGLIKGKIRYIAPEQMTHTQIDPRVDVYAMGVILWQVAAGEPLWKDDQEGVIASRVIRGDIPSPRVVRPDVPESLERICMTALSPDRDARYQSASEFEAAIEELLVEMRETVTNREIGRTVSRLFADVRAYTKSLIDHQLSSALGDQADRARSDAPSILSTNTESSIERNDPSHVEPSTDNKMQKVRRLMVGGGVVVLLFLIARFSLKVADRGPPPLGLRANAVEARDAQVASSAVRSAKTARVGQLPPDNGAERPGRANHRLDPAAAEGAREATDDVSDGVPDPKYPVLERDETSDLGASPSRRLAPKARVAGSVPPSVARKPAANPAKPDCEMPFYINERGIKKLLPECI
jgi:serine/threonine protein kinase